MTALSTSKVKDKGLTPFTDFKDWGHYVGETESGMQEAKHGTMELREMKPGANLDIISSGAIQLSADLLYCQ
jgi:hypothetical protein